jgi:dihydrofolate reductase
LFFIFIASPTPLMMRKIILDLTMSLDGLIEGPSREIDWIEFDEQTGSLLLDFAHTIDTIFYGRVSYELYGNYTGTAENDEAMQQFYDSINKKEKYVFSNTESSFAGTAGVISGDIRSEVERIRNLPGKDIWLFGGASLVTAFMNLDLVDEYQIAIQPVILGAGKPLFKDISHISKLRLVKTESYSSGIVLLHYERR